MVATSLIAALAREHQKQVQEAAKRNSTEDFVRRFSALYGQGAHRSDDPAEPAGTSQAEAATAPLDPTIWEGDETPPERLPDVPTVPDDSGDTPQARENAPTDAGRTGQPIAQAGARNAPTGRLRAFSVRSKTNKRASRASDGAKRATKGKNHDNS